MQVSVEDINPVKKKICVEIPREDVVREINSIYSKLKKTAQIKGFRKGKAPRSVLERHYKKDVHEETISNLISDSYPKAVEESKLKVIEIADIEKQDFDPNSSFTYKAVVELKPELPDIEFRGLKLNKTVYTVSEEEISKQIDMMRKNLTEYVPIDEDRGAEDGDYLSIEYAAFENGVPSTAIDPESDYHMQLGKSKFSEAFDQALAGMRPGENKTISIDFAEDFSDPKLAGKKIVFEVNLKKIMKAVLPPADDEFAKKFGKFESIEELKEKIRDTLRAEYDRRTEQELQEQIFNALIKEEFEVPEALVKIELDGIIRDSERYLAENGLSMEGIGLTREDIAEKYTPTAEKQARRHLVLEKIIEQEGIDMSDQELDEELEKLADTIKQPLGLLKFFYKENPEKLESFKFTMLEKKAIDLILECADISEIPAETKKEENETETPSSVDPEDE